MGGYPVEQMVRIIESECRFTKQFTGRQKLRPEVLDALRRVPREKFVPRGLKMAAYDNMPLPIGKGQTISQPFIVALMTDLLNPGKDDTVLEVGTGSGYQAAILSLLVKNVYSLEIILSLAEQAEERLESLGYGNVKVRYGNGYYGWEEYAPFNGIIVTAAAPHVPPALKKQLKPGGRLVIPVGFPDLPQQLLVLEKDTTGQFTTLEVLSVAFVPLTGGGMI